MNVQNDVCMCTYVYVCIYVCVCVCARKSMSGKDNRTTDFLYLPSILARARLRLMFPFQATTLPMYSLVCAGPLADIHPALNYACLSVFSKFGTCTGSRFGSPLPYGVSTPTKQIRVRLLMAFDDLNQGVPVTSDAPMPMQTHRTRHSVHTLRLSVPFCL